MQCSPQLTTHPRRLPTLLRSNPTQAPRRHPNQCGIKTVFDALANEETFLGSKDAVTPEECQGGRAPNLDPGSEETHAAIMPELVDYSSKAPVTGWPEVPLQDYTKG